LALLFAARGENGTDALLAALANYPLAVRALEELKVLAQTDVERERYEARRKAQLDYNTGMKVAHMDGRVERTIPEIHFCEQLLNRPETPAADLARMHVEELIRLADDLRALVLKQRSHPST
jgi:hypothetical protein